MTAMIEVELFHKTKHEICLSIGGHMLLFHDYISQREYDLGSRIWDAVQLNQKEIQDE